MKVLSYNPQDDWFFVGLSKEEFEKCHLQYPINYGRLTFEDVKLDCDSHLRKDGYREMINELYQMDYYPYVCIVVNRTLTEMFFAVAHYPYSPMWNAYSPWREIEKVEIKSLEELKFLVLNQKS